MNHFNNSNFPIEIRTRIMRLLLEPYFHKDKRDGDIVVFYVVAAHDLQHLKPIFSKDLEHYINHLPIDINERELEDQSDPSLEVTVNGLKTLPQGDREQAETHFQKIKRDFHLGQQRHPARLSCYNLWADVQKEANPSDGAGAGDGQEVEPEWDWPMIRLARDLSNVNTQLRQELGEFLWKRTHISFSCNAESGDNSWNGWEPLAFLLERPKIIKGIRILTIPLVCNAKGWQGVNQFNTFCRYIANVMELEHLQVDIVVADDQLHGLMSGKGKFEGIEVVRQIKVLKSFGIQLQVSSFLRTLAEEESMVEFLMPNSLRSGKTASPEVDGKTKYLANRILGDGPLVDV
jgi:hypothetical protein